MLGDSEGPRRRAVGLRPADARHHVHVIGPTGTGKSTLLANLALGDIAAGRGTVVVDPRGDLVTDLLDRIPAGRVGDVVVIDPAEQEAPVSLNVLEPGASPHLVAEHVVGVFARVFAAWWGPRTDDVLRSACLTLLTHEGSTLADVAPLLADARFRRRFTAGITDPTLRGFWQWYEALTDAGRAQAVAPLMNKLRAVLARPFAADLFGSARSSFDMADVLDGGVLLVRVPKGVVGEDTARLVGSLVVARVWQAALARAEVPEHLRRDCTLTLDEFQNFLNVPGSVEDVLAEARGYGLGLVLAHQHLAQLPSSLADAVSANARSKLWFGMSPEDARVLVRHVEPALSAHDLARTGARRVVARLVLRGDDAPPCTIATRPLPPPIRGRAEAVRAASRESFGVSRERRREEALRRRSPGRGSRGERSGERCVPGCASACASLCASDCALQTQGGPGPKRHVGGLGAPARRDTDSWGDT
jgi:hypothetical protein